MMLESVSVQMSVPSKATSVTLPLKEATKVVRTLELIPECRVNKLAAESTDIKLSPSKASAPMSLDSDAKLVFGVPLFSASHDGQFVGVGVGVGGINVVVGVIDGTIPAHGANPLCM
jgi:hypothetical protein